MTIEEEGMTQTTFLSRKGRFDKSQGMEKQMYA
jgi:hypothetical protein